VSPECLLSHSQRVHAEIQISGVALREPYRHLLKPRTARGSILRSPAASSFGLLADSIRHNHAFGGAVAFCAILAKILPLLLSNVPYQVMQTWRTHAVCTYMAVAILSVMLAVMVWSMLCVRNWPELPVEPGTVAAAMYYICDSQMLKEFEGVFRQPERTNRLTKKAFDKRVEALDMTYQYGKMVGVSGKPRFGIDRLKKTDASI
jgi:hypothetical protein